MTLYLAKGLAGVHRFPFWMEPKAKSNWIRLVGGTFTTFTDSMQGQLFSAPATTWRVAGISAGLGGRTPPLTLDRREGGRDGMGWAEKRLGLVGEGEREEG